MTYAAPEPLGPAHVLAGFACGQEPLDIWLARHARSSQAAGSAKVFVSQTTSNPRVIGYFALAASQVEPADATARLAKGQPTQRPTPVVLLARLAVDLEHQNHGLGTALLRDAALRTLTASNSIGVRAMTAHAKDDAARRWYTRYGFESSPTDPLHMIVLLKDLRKAAQQGL